MSINRDERNNPHYATDTLERKTKRVSERAIDIAKRKFSKRFKKKEENKLYKRIAKKLTLRTFRTIKSVLIASGGGIIAVVVISIMIVSVLLCTGFGILFSNSASGKYSLCDVVGTLDCDFRNQINVVSEKIPHDEIEVVDGSINWKEVLALYAVVAQTKANVFEMVTVDDTKLDIMRDVLNDMYTLSSTTRQHENKTYLCINVSHKTVQEMREKYSLDHNQLVLLDELLSKRNDSMWDTILAGTFSKQCKSRLVEVAKLQVGNVGGEKFWKWYGFSSRVEWCACFVSWCAEQCGYIRTEKIPKFAACESEGVAWFKKHGSFKEKRHVPEPGDIIFFDWDGSNSADHVGIVEKVENGYVHTIEGNSRDECKEKRYPIGSEVIRGYGIIN